MTDSTPKQVLLIGCGNIGLRHLQAVAGSKKPLYITVLEPNTDNRTRAQEAMSDLPPHISVQFEDDWKNVPKKMDLSIVATPAQPRRNLVEKLLEQTTSTWLFMEKVVFVTRRDFADMEALLDAQEVKTVVNCMRRGWGSYDLLRDKLRGKPRLSITVNGSNWNLASNSIHYIDLAVSLFDGLPLSLDASALIPEESKHKGCMEFTGTLSGPMKNGGLLTISSYKEAGHPLIVTIGNNDERWVVEESSRLLTHWRNNEVISKQEFQTPFVSQMGYLYDEMLYENRSRMTTLAIAAQEHGPFLDAIRTRLGQSLEEDLPCPIT